MRKNIDVFERFWKFLCVSRRGWTHLEASGCGLLYLECISIHLGGLRKRWEFTNIQNLRTADSQIQPSCERTVSANNPPKWRRSTSADVRRRAAACDILCLVISWAAGSFKELSADIHQIWRRIWWRIWLRIRWEFGENLLENLVRICFRILREFGWEFGEDFEIWWKKCKICEEFW